MRFAIPAFLILACALPASAADPSAGVIRITATYPGAEAQTVDETVIIPLFHQLVGIEGTARIESEARRIANISHRIKLAISPCACP